MSVGEEAASRQCHRLKSLSVIGGFLDGMNIEFTSGLNCLIGHRGTGKTTVLEFVRYALDEFPKDDAGQARRRVEALVKSNLGDGRIRLALQTKDGLEHIVDRTASGEPLVLTADEQPTDIRINSARLFSADIFSQNEVENIADSPQSQLELIDRFAASQIADINSQIAALRSRLEANSNAVTANQQQLEGLADEVGTLSIIESKIKALAEAQGDQKTDEVNVAHQQRAVRGREEQAVKEARDLLQRYSQWLHEAIGQFSHDANAACPYRAIPVGTASRCSDGSYCQLMSRCGRAAAIAEGRTCPAGFWRLVGFGQLPAPLAAIKPETLRNRLARSYSRPRVHE